MLGGLSLITELISHINLIVEMTSTTLNDFEFIHSPNNTYVHMLVLILISLSIIWPLIIDIYASYVYIWTITLKQFLCEIIKISHKNEHYFLGLEINQIENMNQNPTHHQITVERLFFYNIYYLNLVVSILNWWWCWSSSYLVRLNDENTQIQEKENENFFEEKICI